MEKLKQFPDKEVQNVLKTSFEGLDDSEQNIFLDIAFFYKGHDKDFVGEILDSCGLFFSIGVRNLEDNSLITISENKLCIHDLLQEMGWEIVRKKSEVPGKHSRLRAHEDINHVLTTNTVRLKCIKSPGSCLKVLDESLNLKNITPSHSRTEFCTSLLAL